MTKNPMSYEVPAEMRDFAEKSVAQAKKAFDGFIGATAKAVETIEGQAWTMNSGAKDMTRKAITYAEQNVAAAFELAEKLVRAKDLNEVMAIQSEFAKAQMAAFQAQMKDFSASVEATVKEGGAAVQKAAETVQKEVEKVAKR